jgi:hypothetical protein
MNRLRKNTGKQFHLQYPQKKKKSNSYELNLTEDVNDLYKENYKALKKEMEDGGEISHAHGLAASTQ